LADGTHVLSFPEANRSTILAPLVGKIQDDTVGIGERILANATAVHIFFCYVPEDPTGNVFRNRRWERDCKFRKVFFSVF
jgi:hypothetical protein